MKIKVSKINGSGAGNLELEDGIFSMEPRSDIMSRVVNWQLAKRRIGSHSVKSRALISLTKSKAFKQKGTGRARRGANSVVQFRGGGVVHGPVIRDHGNALNKKIRKLGLKSAISEKAINGNLIVLDSLESDGKTITLRENLKSLGITSAIIIQNNDASEDFVRAVNNIPNVDLLEEMGANVYDILRKTTLVLTKNSVKKLEERLGWTDQL